MHCIIIILLLGVKQRYQIKQGMMDYNDKQYTFTPAFLEKGGWVLKTHVHDLRIPVPDLIQAPFGTVIKSYIRLDDGVDLCQTEPYFKQTIWYNICFYNVSYYIMHNIMKIVYYSVCVICSNNA